MDEPPVTLIVKAPNQQVADQTVMCEPSWTIGRLKGHLERVYPSQPKCEEQKLIYSGRLLSDGIVLKDVLRKFEGQDTHTVHLVCTPPHAKYAKYQPPPKPAPAPAESAPHPSEPPTPAEPDGLRQRRAPQEEAPSPINADDPYRLNREQMAAWASQFNRWAGAAPQPGAPGVAAPPAIDPMMFAAQMAWMQHLRMQQYYNGAAFPNFQPYGNNQQPADSNAANNVQEHHEVAPARREEPDNVNDGEHRDWLDWFYNLSRWILIFSIVYFYSNPLRFLTVFVLGTLIYLFQGRLNNEAAQNERRRGIADNINNNYRPQAANNNNNEPPVQNDPANPAADAGDNMVQATAENPENGNEESLLSITWSAFTSFFTSLIPEVPNGRN